MVTLANVRRTGVLAAVAECNRLGRDVPAHEWVSPYAACLHVSGETETRLADLALCVPIAIG